MTCSNLINFALRATVSWGRPLQPDTYTTQFWYEVLFPGDFSLSIEIFGMDARILLAPRISLHEGIAIIPFDRRSTTFVNKSQKYLSTRFDCFLEHLDSHVALDESNMHVYVIR